MVTTRGKHQALKTTVAWQLHQWALDNPAQAEGLLKALCAASETERLDPRDGDATVRTSWRQEEVAEMTTRP